MKKIILNTNYLNGKPNYDSYEDRIKQILLDMELNKDIPNKYLGWLELPTKYNKVEFTKIKSLGEEIYKKADAIVIIGIGGSYLGARSAIEALTFADENAPEVFYLGNNVNSSYLHTILNKLKKKKEIYVNVISKSGTTLEPALSFRIISEFLAKKYSSEDLKKRIIVTTDKHRGALKQLADEKDYETFVVPDNVGGRYSVLTAVGLLPMAMTGIDIEQIMKGAKKAQEEYSKEISNNDCYKYAINRNYLYEKEGKKIEILATYNPFMIQVAEWWKQLFGESEGKEGKALFPASVNYTMDLHSLGQYIQDGERDIFETVLSIEKESFEILVPGDKNDLDGLGYLELAEFSNIESKIQEAVIRAHTSGNVPNMVINIPELNPYYIGQLFYFFQKSCAISAYLLDLNPFNQPGVEEYKKEMKKVL